MLGSDDLTEALGLAPVLVAADGGANLALQIGQMPAAVIGDMDSIDSEARRRIPADRLHHLPEQETTDFDKCLRSIRAPLVLGVGFMGARLDHQLAAFHSLLCHPGRRCILLGAEDIAFLLPMRLGLVLPEGTRLSLFPLAPGRVSGRGLRWPLDGLELRAGARIGTSNEVAGGAVDLAVDAPGVLALLPRPVLGAAIDGLLASEPHPV